jgi:hypothetical protein
MLAHDNDNSLHDTYVLHNRRLYHWRCAPSANERSCKLGAIHERLNSQVAYPLILLSTTFRLKSQI